MAVKLVLKKEIVKKIVGDPILHGLVAKELGAATTSMPRIFKRQDPALTSKTILLTLCEYLNMQEDDLLEPLTPNNKTPQQTNA